MMYTYWYTTMSGRGGTVKAKTPDNAARSRFGSAAQVTRMGEENCWEVWRFVSNEEQVAYLGTLILVN